MKPIHVIAENEELMKEWDYEKNDALSLDPFSIGMASHTKVWWKCSEGHSWFAMISNRSGHNRGCPYCSHQLPIPGENDLQTLFPEIVKEWHPTKNKALPSDYLPGSHTKVWWMCENGHEWESEIRVRVIGYGCPKCPKSRSRQFYVKKGINDLATMNPELAAEWHPTKNGTLTPEDVTPGSGKKVWWLCSFGHEYQASISNRAKGRGCRKCSNALRTSFPEQAVYYYVKQAFPDAVNSYKEFFKSSMELDVYIPSLKIGIEYDGILYHDSRDMRYRDARKYEICCNNGIRLIRIKESIPLFSPFKDCDKQIQIPNASDEYLNYAIRNTGYLLGVELNPDVRRDRKKILEYLNARKTSLASEYPEIAAEWDYEKNGNLKPEFFPIRSNEKVFWRCKECGYSWEAVISDRTREDAPTGCPDCAARRAAKKRIQAKIEADGSFADQFPELLDEWDYEKNKDINPAELTASSSKKVHWKCKTCGYKWLASIGHRTRGRGCPYCAHRVVISGKNDLATLLPDLLKEWDYEKNSQIGLDPTKLSVRNGKKAFWKCSVCGYEWSAVIATRSHGSGCPNYRKHKYYWDEKQYSLFEDIE